MSIKKMSSKASPKPLTETFLVEQLQSLEKRFDGKLQGLEQRFDGKLQGLETKLEAKIDQTKTFLESKIEYARKDMREHAESTIQGALVGVNQKIDRLDQRMGHMELQFGALHDNVNFIKSDVKEIKEKLNRHDEEIAFLKARVA